MSLGTGHHKLIDVNSDRFKRSVDLVVKLIEGLVVKFGNSFLFHLGLDLLPEVMTDSCPYLSVDLDVQFLGQLLGEFTLEREAGELLINEH